MYTTLTFDRPKTVIQVFANHVDIDKPRWRSRDWREVAAWKEEVPSVVGWVSDNLAVLNESILERKEDFAAAEIILLIDHVHITFVQPPRYFISNFVGGSREECGVRPTYTIDYSTWPQNRLSSRFYHLPIKPDGPLYYGSFDILRVVDGIDLQFVGSRRMLGFPHRDDFRLTSLTINSPIHIVANGRLPSNTDRIYRNIEDIFINLGEFNHFEIRPWNEMERRKHVPFREAALIDLRKELS